MPTYGNTSGSQGSTLTSNAVVGRRALTPRSATVAQPFPTCVAEWLFTEGTGLTAADTAGGHTATAPSAQWVSGKNDTGWGSSTSTVVGLEVPNASTWFPVGAFTLMGWFQSNTNFGGIADIIGNTGGVFTRPAVQLSYRQGLVKFAAGDFATSVTVTDTSAWVHLAITFDGQIARCYLNGAEIGNAPPLVAAVIDPANSLYLGSSSANGWGDTGANARFDEIRVFDAAMTLEQVNVYANPPAGGGVSQNLTPAAGILTASGTAPAVVGGIGRNLAAPAGVLAASGTAPAVVAGTGRNLSVPAGGLAASGTAPSVIAGTGASLATTAGLMTASGTAPVIGQGAGVVATAGVLTASATAPVLTVGVGRNLAAPAGLLTASGTALVVGLGRGLTTTAGVLTTSGTAPAVTTGGGVSLTPPAGVLAASATAPTVAAAATVTTTAGAATISGAAPAVATGTGRALTVPPGIITLATTPPTVTAGFGAAPAAGLVSILATAPAVLAISPNGPRITVVSSALSAAITASGELDAPSPRASGAVAASSAGGDLVGAGARGGLTSAAPTATGAIQ